MPCGSCCKNFGKSGAITSTLSLHYCCFFREQACGYLTDKLVAASLRECAKTVYCLDDQKAINDYTCHSPRIGACVLLHCGGSNELTIKTRLRWESDAFSMYLRNVPCLAAQHNYICNEYDTDNLDPV